MDQVPEPLPTVVRSRGLELFFAELTEKPAALQQCFEWFIVFRELMMDKNLPSYRRRNCLIRLGNQALTSEMQEMLHYLEIENVDTVMEVLATGRGTFHVHPEYEQIYEQLYDVRNRYYGKVTARNAVLQILLQRQGISRSLRAS